VLISEVLNRFLVELVSDQLVKLVLDGGIFIEVEVADLLSDAQVPINVPAFLIINFLERIR
jgi:hypothetical protein